MGIFICSEASEVSEIFTTALPSTGALLKLFSEYFAKQGHGHIISIASVYGSIAPRFEIYEGLDKTMPVEYAAIKAAVIHLTKYMAKYFKGKNIRVNCISPGGAFNNEPKEFVKKYSSHSPMSRMVPSSDIANTLIFLLSDESSAVNGQNIIVDDGWSL